MSPTETWTAADAIADALGELGIHLCGTDTWMFSSTSSAASQPASRSGTSSRSLRGLMRSKFLLDCCHILLATGAAQSQRHQGPGIASSDKDGTSTP